MTRFVSRIWLPVLVVIAVAVGGLAVAQSARRRGVGSALLNAIKAEGERQGARKICLDVFIVDIDCGPRVSREHCG